MQMTLTWGIRKSRSRFATWMEVTEEAAPTTPEITFRTCVLLVQWYSGPTSMLLIEPETEEEGEVMTLTGVIKLYCHAAGWMYILVYLGATSGL